jgi:hypothetical protein
MLDDGWKDNLSFSLASWLHVRQAKQVEQYTEHEKMKN